MGYECCICKGMFEGWPNNASPLATGGCCDLCNTAVITHRIAKSYGEKKRPKADNEVVLKKRAKVVEETTEQRDARITRIQDAAQAVYTKLYDESVNGNIDILDVLQAVVGLV